jgi:hypothetical protein
MNLRITILLLVLVAGGGLVWWYGPRVAPRLGLVAPPVDPDGAGTPDVLNHQLAREKLRRIEVRAGAEPVILEKSASGVWALPGLWPTRTREAAELVELIASLHSRFQVIPLTAELELKPFGLAPEQKPLTVVVLADAEYTLAFGEAPTSPDSGFARPTYVRVNGKPEVMRLGPDLLPILRRTRDFYQRRQLFPDVERVKFTDLRPSMAPNAADPPATTILPKAKEFILESPTGKVVLRRVGEIPKGVKEAATTALTVQLAEQWELVEPIRDRVEPEKLRSLLAAIPELWVEQFVTIADLAKSVGSTPPEPVKQEAWAMERTGLDKPERTIRVILVNGDSRVLQIGAVSRTVERKGTPPPPPPGMPFPPPAPTIREDLRFARIVGLPQLFEVKADKFADLFANADTLRDEKLARFRSNDVKKVVIARGKSTIVLEKQKDDKKADRWRLIAPIEALADNDKVTELLDRFAGLEARDKDVLDKFDPKATGFDPAPATAIALSIEEELPAPGDDKKKREREVAFQIGNKDEKAKKVYVRVGGRDRVNLVTDELTNLTERAAIAYRGRRVLDFETPAVAKVDVKRADEAFVLQQTGDEWRLLSPVATAADRGKAMDLAGELGRLEAVEYVNDNPQPKDLTDAGLDKPSLTLDIAFADDAKKPATLQIGKARDGKPEFFARLTSGSSIFTISKSTRDRLDLASLTYRPAELWKLSADKLTSIKVERAGETYQVKLDPNEAKLTGPFDAVASYTLLQPILDAIAGLRVARYETHQVKNAADFGLDKPTLQITFAAKEKKETGEATVERTLLIGKSATGDKPGRFARVANDAAVFVVDEAFFLNSDKPALDLLDRRLLSLDVSRITKIQGTTPSGPLTLTRDGKTWKAESGPISFVADADTVEATLRAWSFLQASKFSAYGAKVDRKAFGLDAPSVTMTVTLSPADPAGKPETHTIKFGQTLANGDRHIMVDDGAAVAVVAAPVAIDLSRGHLDFVDKSLLKFEPADLGSIQRKTGAAELELARQDGWKVMKPAEFVADSESLDDMTSRLASLRASRVAAFAPTDLKPFGLQDPAATITLRFAGKDNKPVVRTLRIGSPVDAKLPNGDRHARVDDSKVIGIIPGDLASRLLADPIRFRDRTLVRRLPEPDRIEVEQGERRGPNKVLMARIDGTWKLTAPVATEAEHGELEDFLNVVLKLRADELVAENPKGLGEYGLDKPDTVWRFLDGEKEIVKLLIGKKEANGNRHYAKLSNSPMVFLLSDKTTAQARAEYRKRSLWTGFDAAQVVVVTITSDGTPPIVLRKADGNWKIDGKPEVPVKADTVTDLLGALANLKAERFIRDKDAPLDLYGLGKPRRMIVAQTSTGGRQVIHLGNIEGGTKRAYASLPGQSAVFVLSESDTAKIDRDLKAFTGK